MKTIRIDLANGPSDDFKQLYVFDVEPYTLEVMKSKYQAISELDRPIVEIINPGLEQGPWIAGGAAARWFTGETLSIDNDLSKGLTLDPNRVHDIDVFVRSEQDYTFVTKELTTKAAAKTIFDTSNAVTYSCHLDNREWKVQVIKHFFPDVQALLARFDFTCCQIATDGTSFVTQGTAASDIKNRIIRLNGKVAPGLINRMTKYITYGYTPSSELLETISSNDSAISDILSQQLQEYENIIA